MTSYSLPLGGVKESRVADFVSLLKPRVMSLVVFTGFIGLWMAPGEIHPFLACIAIACIALGSGAAGAVNMWFDRDIDQKMSRTKHRPIPSGKVLPSSAIEFAVVASVISVMVMALFVNMMSAAILLTAILFYVYIYTMWLKRKTPQNIVIGGAAGAFPPMIGWAAVTNSITIESLVLFLIIFMWTPPHFWALALYRNEDYKRANVPMLPVLKGQRSTCRHILIYSFILVATTFLPFVIGMNGSIYFATAAILGIKLLCSAVKLDRQYEEKEAKHLFKFSILYLFLLFLSMMLDKIIL